MRKVIISNQKNDKKERLLSPYKQFVEKKLQEELARI